MQPDVVSQLVSVLLPLGPTGVLLVICGYIIRRLYETNIAQQQQILDFAIKSTATMEANTAALNRISDKLVKGEH